MKETKASVRISVVDAARTGDPGNGSVFVTPVERAVNIRTGDEAPRALRE